MTRRINLYGGPGVGKSTLAARVFAHLKQAGTDIELVQEFVKQYVYAGRRIAGWDYVHTFARQFEAEHHLLRGGVQQIVTDSPLLLQCIYARLHGCPVAESLVSICQEFDREYPSVNLFVQRQTRFTTKGRWEDEQEAARIDAVVETTLKHLDIEYHTIDSLDPKVIDRWLTLLERL